MHIAKGGVSNYKVSRIITKSIHVKINNKLDIILSFRSVIFHSAARTAIWTGDTRDTRHKTDERGHAQSRLLSGTKRRCELTLPSFLRTLTDRNKTPKRATQPVEASGGCPIDSSHPLDRGRGVKIATGQKGNTGGQPIKCFCTKLASLFLT